MSEKEDALASLMPREEPITVGPLACVMREMQSAADVLAFVDTEDTNYKLVVRSLLGPHGAPMFTDADIPKLKSGSFKKVQALIEAAQRVNGLNTEVESKNSPPQSSDSSTT